MQTVDKKIEEMIRTGRFNFGPVMSEKLNEVLDRAEAQGVKIESFKDLHNFLNGEKACRKRNS